MSRTTNNLYMFVSWLTLVAGTYIVLQDVLNSAGLVSAFVLYKIIGNMHDYETKKAYYSSMAEEFDDDESNEAKGK